MSKILHYKLEVSTAQKIMAVIPILMTRQPLDIVVAQDLLSELKKLEAVVETPKKPEKLKTIRKGKKNADKKSV